jgi:predicted esterase
LDSIEVLSVETPTHGRVLVSRTSGTAVAGWLIAFHGYGQNADDALADVRQIPGAERWNVAAVQGLHRFYTRNDEKIVASWMTRQDRDAAIADNIEYVDRVVAQIAGDSSARVVFVGFSQGVAMAYRAAVAGRRAAAGVIALGGDIPPELRTPVPGRQWPRVLIGAGRDETWYTEAKVQADVAMLQSLKVTHDVVRYRGGHQWTEEFRAAAAIWLRQVLA